jgi:hypothetical protein
LPGLYRFENEELRELASIWSMQNDVLSLYFRPGIPSELAHRGESVRAKEVLQQQLRTLHGNGRADRGDIERILDVISAMKGDHRLTKVIFACKSLGLWREYDLAGDFETRFEVGSGVAIAPLIAERESRKRYGIVLADRNRARLLLLEVRQLTEQGEALEEEGREKIRTTGARKSVHLERKKEEAAREHFTIIANRLLHFYEHGDFDWLLVGCRDDMWPEIEAELQGELKRVLAGRFRVDPGLASHEEIAELAQQIVDARDREAEQQIVGKIMGGAQSDRLGATGIEPVMDALEKGEVRTLAWTASRTRNGGRESDGVSNCSNCRHLESGRLQRCELCGNDMHWFARDEEALVRHALSRNIEARMLHYSKLPPPDEVGAWLRFQAEHSTAQALTT